jgi:hypothetical protein
LRSIANNHQLATRNPRRTRRRSLLLVFFLLALGGAFSFASTAKFQPFIERFPGGKVDWDQGYFYGTGVGYPHLNQGSKAKALKVAEAGALSAILQVAAGLRLDDRRTLANFQKEKAGIRLQALIRHEDVEKEFVQEGKMPFYRVSFRAPMKGIQGLTRGLLPYVRSGILPERIGVKPEQEEEADEGAPWLVLDARGLAPASSVQPALFPKIVTEQGETLLDLNLADEGALVQRGMARYVVSDKSREEILAGVEQEGRAALTALLGLRLALAQEQRERKRQGKLIVKDVTQVQGLQKTNLVISEADARDIREEDASSRILKKCRVIVVVSSSVGGIEGWLPGRLACLW